jgi:hypothetical protein
MFNQILLLIYRLFLCEGRRRVDWIEEHFGFDGGVALSCGDKRNEPGTYEILFSQEHQEKLKQLYLELLNEMNGVTYQHCGNVHALAFIQEVSATALWKYRQILDVMIEEFVRNFDRLDIPEERVRLYESAQK